MLPIRLISTIVLNLWDTGHFIWEKKKSQIISAKLWFLWKEVSEKETFKIFLFSCVELKAMFFCKDLIWQLFPKSLVKLYFNLCMVSLITNFEYCVIAVIAFECWFISNLFWEIMWSVIWSASWTSIQVSGFVIRCLFWICILNVISEWLGLSVGSAEAFLYFATHQTGAGVYRIHLFMTRWRVDGLVLKCTLTNNVANRI